MSQPNASGQAGFIRVDIVDQDALYQAYMPFLQNGGLFVSRHQLAGSDYHLGAEVFLFVHLLFEDERMPVSGKVCWVTPSGSHQSEGVGVQFLQKDGGQTQARLENLLADRHDSDQATQTL